MSAAGDDSLAGAEGATPLAVLDGWVEAAVAAHAAGDYALAVREAQRALDRAAPDNATVRARAALMVGKASWNTDLVRQSAEALAVAVREGEAAGLNEVVAEALALKGACHAREEDAPLAVATLQRAVALLDAQATPQVQRAVYTGVGLSYQGLGLARQAVEAFRRALDITRANSPVQLQLRAAMNLCYGVEEAVWQMQQFDAARARALLDETLPLLPWMESLARQIGTPHAEQVYLDASSRLQLLAGQNEAARSALERLLALGADAAGDLRCDWHLALARLAHEELDADGQAWQVAAARHAAGEAYQQPATPADLRRAAELLAFEGRPHEALQLAWRSHARLLHNETAAMEARLQEMAASLAHKTLQLEVADLRMQNAGLEDSFQRAQELARVDVLTGALNRRGLEAEFAAGLPLSRHLLLLDLDHFKQINDRFGHPVGDVVLKRVMQTIAAALRDNDRVGRLGGEEFAVLLGDTHLGGARRAADRLRRLVERREWGRTAEGLRVTFSGGLVPVVPGEPFDRAVERADVLLYRAKHQGRNRIVAESDAPDAAEAP